MKDLLLAIKAVYLDYVSKYKTKKGYRYTGLTAVGFCSVVKNNFEYDDAEKFEKYLKKITKNQKVFYTYDGVETGERNQFVWNAKDIQVRLDWLDEQILKFKD